MERKGKGVGNSLIGWSWPQSWDRLRAGLTWNFLRSSHPGHELKSHMQHCGSKTDPGAVQSQPGLTVSKLVLATAACGAAPFF